MVKETPSKKVDLGYAWDTQIFEALENFMRSTKKNCKEGCWIVEIFRKDNNKKGYLVRILERVNRKTKYQ